MGPPPAFFFFKVLKDRRKHYRSKCNKYEELYAAKSVKIESSLVLQYFDRSFFWFQINKDVRICNNINLSGKF